ncbi:MAG: hypothetical protein ABID63_16800 [Pseudomonadota bacterium]
MRMANWLFPASGAAYGLAFWYLASESGAQPSFLMPMMTFVATLAFAGWFVAGVRDVWRDSLVALVLAGLAGLQVWLFDLMIGFAHVDDISLIGLMLCQMIWVWVAVAAWRVWGPVKDTVLPPEKNRALLVPEIWLIKISLAFGVLAIGLFWGMIYVLSVLLELVGIDDIWDYIGHDPVASALTGLAFATGLLLVRMMDHLLVPVRQVIGAMFRVLYPLQALGLLLFLILAAFGGWRIFLAREDGVWWTVIAGAFALSYLLFGTVQADNRPTLFGRYGDRVFRATLWMAPLLSLMALAAIYVRIDDYGLTPSRLYGVWVAVFSLIATFWLACAAFGRRQSTPDALRGTFGHILISAAGVAFILHLPMIDPVSMSVRSQMQRIVADDQPDQNDLVFMAQDLGKPGEAALIELAGLYPDQVADIATLRARYIGQNRQEDTVAVDHIPVFPGGTQLTRDQISRLLENELKYARQNCLADGDIADRGGQNMCALLLVDLDADGREEAVFFGKYPFAEMYALQDGKTWQPVLTFRLGSDITPGSVLEALEAGDYRTVIPRYRDLEIGGQRWEQHR